MSSRVRDDSERRPTEFGWVVLGAMTRAGFERQADLARAAGIPTSTISRLIYNPTAPSRESLDKLAKVLDLGDEHRAPTVIPRERDPLVVEVEFLLGADSTLPESEREFLRESVARLVESSRRRAGRARPAKSRAT